MTGEGDSMNTDEAPDGVKQGKQGDAASARPTYVGGYCGGCGELVYANDDGSEGSCGYCGAEPDARRAAALTQLRERMSRWSLLAPRAEVTLSRADRRALLDLLAAHDNAETRVARLVVLARRRGATEGELAKAVDSRLAVRKILDERMPDAEPGDRS